MKTKFTKGEFIIDGYCLSTGILPTDETICTIKIDDEYPSVYDRSKEEAYANLKLFRAAPEMLKALIELRNYFGEQDKTIFEHKMFAIADQVIKKAIE